MKSILAVIIICGVGIVASITYIICLLVFSHKKSNAKYIDPNQVSQYELLDDDTIVIPFKR